MSISVRPNVYRSYLALDINNNKIIIYHGSLLVQVPIPLKGLALFPI